MKHNKTILLFTAGLLALSLGARVQASPLDSWEQAVDLSDPEAEDCPNCEEADLNAPIDGTNLTDANEEFERDLDIFEAVEARKSSGTALSFPAFKAEWNLAKEKFEKAKNFYANSNKLSNRRYVVIIDFSKRSSEKRMYIFDLAKGSVERHITAHGKGSDKNGDGIAESFSNSAKSHASSLGFYVTKNTYNGKHGRSLVLGGLSKSNSNAQSRAVVIHGARYVNESAGRAGRSWGCPALDPKVIGPVISKIKGGSLVMIDN